MHVPFPRKAFNRWCRCPDLKLVGNQSAIGRRLLSNQLKTWITYIDQFGRQKVFDAAAKTSSRPKYITTSDKFEDYLKNFEIFHSKKNKGVSAVNSGRATETANEFNTFFGQMWEVIYNWKSPWYSSCQRVWNMGRMPSKFPLPPPPPRCPHQKIMHTYFLICQYRAYAFLKYVLNVFCKWLFLPAIHIARYSTFIM